MKNILIRRILAVVLLIIARSHST